MPDSADLKSSLAPWRSPLARNLYKHRALPQSRYLQLATVDLTGRPTNRTVVFRGFLEHSNQLKFVCDRRSQKILHIQHQPWAEACWYFPNTREQFRLAGEVIYIDAESANMQLQKMRHHAWHQLSASARVQFGWAEPGTILSLAPQPSMPIDPAIALPNFCLLLLDPVTVDRLELRGNPQNRWQYQRDLLADAWLTQALNP